MKKEIEQLEQTIHFLNEKLDQRESLFDNRSDKWQESEKGEQYSDKTELLRDVISDLENALEQLNEFMEL